MSLLPFSEKREKLEIPAPLFQRITLIPEAVQKVALAEARYGIVQKVGSHLFNTPYTPMLEKRTVPVVKSVIPPIYEVPDLLDDSNEPVPLSDEITNKEQLPVQPAPVADVTHTDAETEREARIVASRRLVQDASTKMKGTYDPLAQAA